MRSYLALAVSVVALGCSGGRRSEVDSTRRSLSTANGLWQNGLTTNGLWQNGLWQNGLWQNGLWQNGLWQNGLWQNGLWQNGLWQNGLWQNGLWQNGLWQNGLWQNGLWQNGLWQNGLAGDAAAPGNMLRNSASARALLRYLYECAMPAATYDGDGHTVASYATTLDPNTRADGTGGIPCSAGGADGGASCDVGYECSAEGKCVVPLKGAIGLAINDDGTTWWGQPAPGGATNTSIGKWGQCDESCQRWVSACLLARTNAYGVHVGISLRAPANPPVGASPGRQLQFAAVKAALAPDPSTNELTTFTNREGAYYGNVFGTTPFSTTKGTCTTINGNVTCPAVGPIVSTPSFFACAGPDSNIPQITKRFCSSQGDQVVVRVPGICAPRPTELGTTAPGVCNGIDSSGSVVGCNTCAPASAACITGADCCSTVCSLGRCSGAGSTLGKHYDEVITVYQQQQLTVCGNGVCEAGESPSDPTACPSDCHPGSWAKDYLSNLGEITYPGAVLEFGLAGLSAVAPDDTVVLTGNAMVNSVLVNLDLGGGMLPASAGIGVLAKYDSQGHYLWGTRFGATPLAPGISSLTRVGGVTVAANGNIIVVGAASQTATGNSVPVIYTFGADGGSPASYPSETTPVAQVLPAALAVLPPNVPTLSGLVSYMVPYGRTTVDSHGNVIMTVNCAAPATFGGFSFTPVETHSLTPARYNTCIVKASPLGLVKWAKSADGDGSTFPYSLAADAHDDLVFVGTGSTPNMVKLSGATGTTIWAKNSPFVAAAPAFSGATFDANGNVYATGHFNSGATLATMLNPSDPSAVFGSAIPVVTGRPPFIVKYDASGAFQWVNYANIVCPPNLPACNDSSIGVLGVRGLNITFDPAGNVILGSYGNAFGGGVDFGVGTFPTYGTPNVFLSAYSTQGTSIGQLLWAKHIPMVLKSSVSNLDLDSQGRVVVSGAYSGSMQVDGNLLMTTLPEDPNVTHAYLASFGAPSTSDTAPPEIGFMTDQTGAPIVTVPSDIVAEATTRCGANVFFMPPTATDTGAGGVPAGVTVSCSPRPNTVYPIGTTANPKTNVTCTASDPLGNKAFAQFDVTVVDTTGPVISPQADIDATAPDASGVVVTFAPTALDQVDCSSSTCVPSAVACITPTCTPASGSLFPVGHTTVTCVAKDNAQNRSELTFNVNVQGPDGPCTTSAQCASGACVDGVCCNLPDPTATSCGQCQACNVAGSVGTCAPISGATCSDGNACTQSDTCQNGACVGGTAVTCGAGDQCHAAGTCDPATGACSNPPAANGTACNDGNACTGVDQCLAGTCTGASPVTCAASDQCHAAGVCDPSTGACSSPPAANGTPCNDGNACTTADVCNAGACGGGAAKSCDDLNPCTVDSCSAASGCVNTPGNTGAVCRAAGGTCDSAETCTGTSATCPANADKVVPKLNPGTNQTIVGSCSSTPAVFALPTLVGTTCEGGTAITCTWTAGGTRGTCAKASSGASLPGNHSGAHTVTCTAKDAAGNVSAPVSFSVTVLQPLTVKVQPPLSGDNLTVNNVVKAGSTVPVKVQLFACGSNVTRTAAVTAKLAVASMPSGGSTVTKTVVACTDTPNTSGVMVLDGANYRYYLSTKGYAVTAAVPAFFQLNLTVAYKSAATVVVGSDAIQLDTK